MKILAEKISAEIEAEKTVSFARFMELALYCPNSGFYEQEADNIGRRGDYFTSVSVGSVFGELLAFQFAEWLEAEARSQKSEVRIVEAGAHDGKLARDILSCLREFRPRAFETVQYCIVEPSARRRDWQSKNLREFEQRIHWASSLEELNNETGGVRGVVFSNEFLDAFPVHRLGWDSQKREWFEWGVAVHEGEFIWMRMPGSFVPDFGIGDDELAGLLDVLPDGFVIEVCPAATDWWRAAAGILVSGKLLTIDYGLAGEDFFSPERRNGTLRAYHKHQLNPDVLVNAGEQDITAHVNFGVVQKAGEECGLKTEMLATQEKFLNGIVAKVSARSAEFPEWSPSRTRQLQTLVHPEHLGSRFRALVQSRR